MTLDGGALRIRSATAADVPRLESGWRALYVLQREQGMNAIMPPDAFALWSGSMVPGLGRFTNLFLAEADGVLSGFLAARLRRAAAWFGGASVGFVSEVWVEEAARGAKVGEALVRAAEEWFRAQDVKRVELQVMLANTPARKLYAKLGWRDELLQMATDL